MTDTDKKTPLDPRALMDNMDRIMATLMDACEMNKGDVPLLGSIAALRFLADSSYSTLPREAQGLVLLMCSKMAVAMMEPEDAAEAQQEREPGQEG